MPYHILISWLTKEHLEEKKIHINIILRSVSSLHECTDFLIVEITINTTISINLVNYLLFKTSA